MSCHGSPTNLSTKRSCLESGSYVPWLRSSIGHKYGIWTTLALYVRTPACRKFVKSLETKDEQRIRQSSQFHGRMPAQWRFAWLGPSTLCLGQRIATFERPNQKQNLLVSMSMRKCLRSRLLHLRRNPLPRYRSQPLDSARKLDRKLLAPNISSRTVSARKFLDDSSQLAIHGVYEGRYLGE